MASMFGRCLPRKCLQLTWSPLLNVQYISHSAVLRCQSRADITRIRAAEFMADIDKNPTYKERKEIIEEYIETWKRENIILPDTISDENWMVLLTERYRYHASFKYLQFVLKRQYIKQNEKLKKETKRLEREQKKIDNHTSLPEFSLHIPDRERQEYRWNKLKVWRSDIPIVIDMDFPDASDREQKAAVSQLSMAVRQNSSYPQPLQLHMTSINQNKYLADLSKSNTSSPTYYYEEHFTDIFPLEQLFYLSPDGPTITNLNPNVTYIIGGLVDRGCGTRLTYGIAKRLGIRCGSLPLYHYARLDASARKNLNINTVLEIMQCMYLNRSWKSAFEYGLISQKYTVFDDPSQRRNSRQTNARKYLKYNSSFLQSVKK